MVIHNALSVRRSCPRPWGYGSKVGNQAQPGLIIINGREIWDSRTLSGRCTMACSPSAVPVLKLGIHLWGLAMALFVLPLAVRR